MTSPPRSSDTLDEVLAELDQARHDGSWSPAPGPTRRDLHPPEILRQGRWVPSRSALVVVALSAIVAAAIFTARWLLSDTGQDRPATSTTRVSISGASSASVLPGDRGRATSAASAVNTSAGAGRWSIHVIGAVRHAGVVTVTPDARVSDAIQAAGGFAPGADASAINLARKLSDGEQVHVPRPGEKWTPPSDAVGSPGMGSGTVTVGPTGRPGGTSAGGSGGQVRLNEATLEQLESLPGVGPVMAQRILEWRQQHGRFTSVDELGEVSGIGDKTLERLRPQVAV